MTKIWIAVLLLAAGGATTLGYFLWKPPDVERVREKNRIALGILARLEREVSEWGEERAKFTDELDEVDARFLRLLEQRERVEPDYLYFFWCPDEIKKKEDDLAFEIRAMEADIHAWTSEIEAVSKDLERLEIASSEGPEAWARALRQEIRSARERQDLIVKNLKSRERTMNAASPCRPKERVGKIESTRKQRLEVLKNLKALEKELESAPPSKVEKLTRDIESVHKRLEDLSKQLEDLKMELAGSPASPARELALEILSLRESKRNIGNKIARLDSALKGPPEAWNGALLHEIKNAWLMVGEIHAILVEAHGDLRNAREVLGEQFMDEEVLIKVVDKIVEGNPESVGDFREGKEKQAVRLLLGEIRRETKWRSDPEKARALLEKALRRAVGREEEDD